MNTFRQILSHSCCGFTSIRNRGSEDVSAAALIFETGAAGAAGERRTKSELFREMVRVYQRFRDQRNRDEAHWVANLIQEAKAEQTKKSMTVDEILAESERLARAGEKQAKKLGLKTDPKSINHLIHARRNARKSA